MINFQIRILYNIIINMVIIKYQISITMYKDINKLIIIKEINTRIHIKSKITDNINHLNM